MNINGWRIDFPDAAFASEPSPLMEPTSDDLSLFFALILCWLSGWLLRGAWEKVKTDLLELEKTK